LKFKYKAILFLALQILFWSLILYCAFLLLLICLQYIPVQFDIAFLTTKQSVIGYTHYKIAFFTHVFSAIFTILFGSFQFVNFIKHKFKKAHRFIGKLYISILLLLAGPSGLVMSVYANGGVVSQISFALLSTLWMIFTYVAYHYAAQKKFALHQAFMIRSYALTLSAISLRLLKLGMAHTFSLPPMDTYVIVSWASWLLNLAIAEFIIFNILPKK
jgi:hypothetical protein